jgi:hypothetical protein
VVAQQVIAALALRLLWVANSLKDCCEDLLQRREDTLKRFGKK